MANNSEKLAQELARLSLIIEKMTLPIPAIPAIPAIPPIPQIPAIAPLTANLGDHDTLTALVVAVSALDKKVEAMSSKLDDKYTTKEEHKVVTDVQIDHEARIRIQETVMTQIQTMTKTWILVGGTIWTAITILATHFLH